MMMPSYCSATTDQSIRAMYAEPVAYFELSLERQPVQVPALGLAPLAPAPRTLGLIADPEAAWLAHLVSEVVPGVDVLGVEDQGFIAVLDEFHFQPMLSAPFM
jgi:hypothetical protein